MSKIKVEGLTKIFGNNTEKALALLEQGRSKDEILKETGQAVGIKDLSFEVKEGEIFVVMGLSGSGKSTLIRCLNRLIDPSKGEIYIDGVEITALNEQALREFRRNKQAMVFQQFALFPHRTILENSAFGLEIQKLNKTDRLEMARQSLKVVGLEGWEDRYPEQLSGGMQQRVGLARALAVNPDILLMDEPFSALDPLIRREMQDELLDLQKKMKKTIIFITHDLDEALKLGDRVALMKDGEIVQLDIPEVILTAPATEYVAKFVEDVDLSKVLTAESVMKNPEAVAFSEEDPGSVLEKLKNMNIPSIFVKNHEEQFLGYILSEDAAIALERGEKALEGIIRTDYTAVLPDTTLNKIFELSAHATIPLVVIGEDHELRGVISDKALLAGLVKEDYQSA